MKAKCWAAALFMTPVALSGAGLMAKTMVVKPPPAHPAVRPAPATTPVVGTATAPASVGWVKIDLLDDPKAPDNPIFHKDQDIVSAMWFRDLNHGVIGTMEGETHSGGIIYTASGPKLTGIAFRGYQQASVGQQDVSFRDFVSTPDGVVALVQRSDTYIHSDNDFKFTSEPMGGEFGTEPEEWLTPTTAGKWFIVTGTGTVRTATDGPGKGADWNVLWFPEGNPPVPNPVPAGMATDAPSSNTPSHLPFRFAYVSPDGQFIAYPFHSKTSVCICKDGGKTWKEVPLPNPPASAEGTGPYGIYFTDKLHGWVFYGNDLKDGSCYVYSTTDGGDTWTAGKLPDAITAADSKANLRSIFFAPDNKWGWLVGYKGDNTKPVLMRTSDGGATWTDKSGGKTGIAVVADPPMKLYSGFALDKDHIWVGGDHGGLFYCDTASR